ncbi:MAG: nucleotidyltransferase family protein [Acidobacteria bacterium]|nr:nucleotidyltransferase family protein [Acidobacteriota bacterium]
MSRRTHAHESHALGTARALAGTGPSHAIDIVLERLARGDAEAAQTWSVLLHGGLLPALAYACEQRDGPTVNGPLRESLRSALDVNTLRNALLRRETIEASRALLDVEITPLLMKGIWLAHERYPHPGIRTMADVDLIVPVGTRERARRALEAIGFRRVPPAGPDGADTWTDTFTRPAALPGGETSVELDLHDALRMSRAREWPVERLWQHAHRTRFGPVTVLTPSREAGLLYLAAHVFKHGFDLRHALVAIGDASAILHGDDGLDLEWMDAELQDTRDALAVYLLLTYLGDVPTSQGRELHARVSRRLEQRGLRRDADRLLAAASQLTLLSGTDFSLFDVGEQQSMVLLLRRLVAGAFRWRGRVRHGESGSLEGVGLARLARRANWRYAYTTFLAGRLHARSEPPIPS